MMSATIMMQAAIVKGKVQDQNKDALEFVNVGLYQGEKLIKGTTVDMTGKFQIDGVKPGTYKLKMTYVGYRPFEQTVTIKDKNDNVNLHTLTMDEDHEVLAEAEVVTNKATMRLDIDKKIFDIGDQAAAAGLNASEALESIPSVEVDSEGNISLRGSESVTIWINGKAQGLTSDNRGDILQQMPAESIDHIEVITNPSSKYSPEGSAGIINIILKRDRKAGYYGGVKLSINNEKGGRAGANINYSSGIIDAYFNVGYGLRRNNGGNYTDRTFISGGKDYANLLTEMSQDNKGHNLFFRTGLNWHPTKNDDIGIGYMGMRGKGNYDSDYNYTFRDFNNPANNYHQLRQRRNNDDPNMNHFDVNYTHRWADNHTLEASYSFSTWSMHNESDYYNSKEMPNATGVKKSTSEQAQYTEMNNKGHEVKIDYARPMFKYQKMEAGYKGEWRRENTPNQTWSTIARLPESEEPSLYNKFIYDMDVHAAYLNWGGKITKTLSYQVGVRNEYWKVHTMSYDWDNRQKGTDPEAYDRHFNELFPTAFISWQATQNDEFQVNYTRRLRRPWGGQMNSFKNINDSTSISYGNPRLKSVFVNSLELNYLHKWEDHTLSASLFYRPSDNNIQSVSYLVGTTRYQTSVNVGSELSTGLELIAKNKVLWRKVDLTTTLNMYYYNLEGGDFEVDVREPGATSALMKTISVKDDSQFTWNVKMQAQIMLPGKVSMGLTGQYTAPRAITQGKRKATWYMDASLKRSFFDGKFTVTLNGRNLFDSRRGKSDTEGEGFRQYSESWRGGRRIILQLGYTFGNMGKGKGKGGRSEMDDNDNNDRNGEEQYAGGDE